MTTLDDIANTLEKIELRQDHFMREVETIKRGIYGDLPNNVKGLIQTDQEQHARIESLETAKNKAYWMVGGVALSGPLIWEFVKSKLGL